PRTNGMVERFNGRVQREVLGVTVAGHRDLERLLEGFNQAYNARRQRVLDGRSPEEVVRERLAQDRGLANPGYRPPSDPCVLPRAMLVIERAKDVSQPDSYAYYRCCGSDAYRFGGQRVCSNAQVRTDRLDAAVWHEVERLLRNPARIATEYERRLD